jgi:hypothetical protein
MILKLPAIQKAKATEPYSMTKRFTSKFLASESTADKSGRESLSEVKMF